MFWNFAMLQSVRFDPQTFQKILGWKNLGHHNPDRRIDASARLMIPRKEHSGIKMGWLPLGLLHTFGRIPARDYIPCWWIRREELPNDGKNGTVHTRPLDITLTTNALCSNRENAGILSRRNLTSTLVHLGRCAPYDTFCQGFPNLHMSSCISYLLQVHQSADLPIQGCSCSAQGSAVLDLRYPQVVGIAPPTISGSHHCHWSATSQPPEGVLPPSACTWRPRSWKPVVPTPCFPQPSNLAVSCGWIIPT